MEIENGRMNFTPDEQTAGEVPASSSVDNASILYTKLDETLHFNSEKLWALQTADDDQVLSTERAQIGALIKKVHTLERLKREIGSELIEREIQSFRDTDDS